MTPDQFLSAMKSGPLSPAYLFLGPETWQRPACRAALLDRVLPQDERAAGFISHDLDETTVSAVVDDAMSFSLFAPRRVIWAARAEAVLPKGKAIAADDDAQTKTAGAAGSLAPYLRSPTPDTVLVFDSARFDFDGEDKAKSERVRKFYASVPAVVEFPRWTPLEARRLAQDTAKAHQLRIAPEDLNLLVEVTGASPSLIVMELEKLRLFAGPGGNVTAEDIARLVPQAQATTVFALVDALARNDRKKALDLLDLLIREGEYLPLALSFLANQFRQALAAREAGLRQAAQIQSFFQRQGVQMWPSRAEQIIRTMNAFPAQSLAEALRRIAGLDLALRDIRPDDRLVMEQFVLAQTR